MLDVRLEVPPELRSRPGRYKHKSRMHSDEPRRFSTSGTHAERVWQRKQMGIIIALIDTLHELNCKGSVSINVQEGHATVEGTISAIDEDSQMLAEEIGADIEVAAHNLAENRPMCSFFSTSRFEFTVTEVSEES